MYPFLDDWTPIICPSVNPNTVTPPAGQEKIEAEERPMEAGHGRLLRNRDVGGCWVGSSSCNFRGVWVFERMIRVISEYNGLLIFEVFCVFFSMRNRFKGFLESLETIRSSRNGLLKEIGG